MTSNMTMAHDCLPSLVTFITLSSFFSVLLSRSVVESISCPKSLPARKTAVERW